MFTSTKGNDEMTNFERIINELNRKGVPFFVKNTFEKNQVVSRTLSKITITIGFGEVGQKLYYANGKLISKRLATKLGVAI